MSKKYVKLLSIAAHDAYHDKSEAVAGVTGILKDCEENSDHPGTFEGIFYPDGPCAALDCDEPNDHVYLIGLTFEALGPVEMTEEEREHAARKEARRRQQEMQKKIEDAVAAFRLILPEGVRLVAQAVVYEGGIFLSSGGNKAESLGAIEIMRAKLLAEERSW